MMLGVPVIDQQGLTQQMIRSLTQTVRIPTDFHLVIIDNNSDIPYVEEHYKEMPFRVSVIRYERNEGYYYPLLDLYNKYGAQEEYIGLVHNDIVFYEYGWDDNLKSYFQRDNKLGLVGLCGSNQVDAAGGRGGGTMCYFRGAVGQPQSAGQRITDLRPAALLDSLFMMFSRDVIPLLGIDKTIAPCHFYDKIWSLRTIEHGYHVAVMGSEVDHIGGQTAVLIEKFKAESARWLHENHIPFEGDPRTAVYVEAERRFLTEYRSKKMIPGSVDSYYNFK